MIFVPPWQSWALRDMSFDPRHVPGCQLFACTDTTAFPQAVVFPADVVVNGAFAADATWTKGANWTIPTPYALHAAGSTATLSQAAILVVGNTYATRIVVSNATAGTVTVNAGTTAGTARFNGDFTESLLCAGNTTLSITPTNDFDGRVSLVKADPRNASQFTDLTGTGHHLLQATPAKQPLWVVSGAGGYLSFDGVADALQAIFALDQPVYVAILVKQDTAAANQIIVGGQNAGLRCIYNGSANGLGTLSASAGPTLAMITNTWYWYDAIFANGANLSTIAKNGGAPVLGDVGLGAWDGVTVAANKAMTGNLSKQDVAAIAVYNRMPSESERQRLYRWSNRLRGRLAL